MTHPPAVGYARLREGTVARTVQVSEDLLADLDGNDHILGIEMLGAQDWTGALVMLAMAGRLAVPGRGDLWP